MPLRRFANFIAERRLLVLVVLIAVCALCALQIPNVSVVADQSAYLSESSETRTGLEIIDREFPEVAHENSVRVMFRGLVESARADVERQLLRTPYVATVTYGDGPDYYRDPYSLYVLTTEYPYGSPQQRDLMEGLERNFKGYDMTVANDSAGASSLPWWVLPGSFAAAALILFALCRTWLEPLLILACAALASGANAGTNILLEQIAQLSASLSPILVLLFTAVSGALYAAVWRREYAGVEDPYEATVRALTGSFAVLGGGLIASGGTFLMLIFLRSGLAADLGVVAAKGALWSFLCVTFGMPPMMLMGAGVLLRTQRRGPVLRGRELARSQFDRRRALTTVLLVVFAVSCVLTLFINPAFGITKRDAIAAEFPQENEIVVVYQNGDENPAGTLANRFSRMPDVSGVSSYATTLGRQYTAQEMYAMLHATGSSMTLSLPLLEILYYDRFTDAQLPFITAGELIRFINTEVDGAEGLGDLLSAETVQLFNRMAPFTDPEQLSSPLNISQAGAIFGISQDEAIELFSQYYTVRGGDDTENMTADTFLEYVLSVIAEDPQYAEEMTEAERDRLQGLAAYADPGTASEPVGYAAAAARLGIDETVMRTIYTEYFAGQSSYAPGSMTLPQFISFMQDSVLDNSYFAGTLPDGTGRRLTQAAGFTDSAAYDRQMGTSELSAYLHIGEDAAREIVGTYHQTDTGQMTLPQFLTYVTGPDVIGGSFASTLSAEQRTMLPRLNAAVQAAVAGRPLTAESISQITALPLEIVDSVFTALSAEGETPVESMMLDSFLTAVTSGAYQNAISETDMAQLELMAEAVQAAPQGQQYTAAQIAPLVGLDTSQTSRVYTMFSRTQSEDDTMSPLELVQYVLSEPGLQTEIGEDATDALTAARRYMDAGQAALSPDGMASLFNLSGQEAKLLFTYHDAISGTGASWTIPLGTLLAYLVRDDSPAADLVPEDDRAGLRLWARIAEGAAAGREYSPPEMAELLGLDEDFTVQVFRRYLVDSGEVETWTVPMRDLVNFIATTGDAGFQGPGLEWVRQLSPLIDAVAADRQYSALGFYMLLESIGQEIDESTVELIYLYYASQQMRNTMWTMSPLELIDYLADDVLEQPAYSAYLDSTMSERIRELQDQIEAASRRLKGDNYSMMTVSTTLPLGSPEMRSLFDTITTDLDSTMVGTYYLLGNIPASYEMSEDFSLRLILLTLLTDLCAFVAACLVMRSLLVPLAMVLLSQTCVWLVEGVLGLFGSTYYLALLVGQCFVISQTVLLAFSIGEDYRRRRHRYDIEESMRALFDDGTAMSVLMSGLVMIAVFLFIWIAAPDTAPGQIAPVPVFSVTIGVLLVLLVLPALLGAADRYIRAKTLPAIPLEQKARPGGDWEGKRLLDEDTLVGLSRNTFVQPDEQRPAAPESEEAQPAPSQKGGDES